MKAILFSCLVSTAVILSGCGKSETATTAEGEIVDESGVPRTANPQINAALNSVSSDVEARRYDAAISKLGEMKDLPMNQEEHAQFRAKMIETQDALAEQAKTDPQARERYQALGRMMMGR